MAMSMKDFLTLYFRQLHFNEMPEPVRARFDEYVKKQDFRGDMKSWADDLLAKNADGKPFIDKGIQPDGHFVHNDLPDALTELGNDDWAKLYMALQRAFASMDSDRESLNKNTVKFLDKYFGANKVFEPVPLDDRTKNAVAAFSDIFETENVTGNNGQTEVVDNAYSLFRRYAGVEDASKADYEEFKQSVIDGSYEKKPDIRRKLVRFVDNLQYADLSQLRGFQHISEKIYNLADAGVLTQVVDGLGQTKEPTATDITKLKARYSDILTTLHDDKKVADDFKRFDNGKISKPMEDAIAKTDYSGAITKKDFIPEKIDDRKTLRQRIEDKAHNIYDDVLKKWLTLHRDHIYVLPTTAKPIVDVMTGKDFNLKPTDGLKAIMEKSDAIAGKLQAKSPKAAEHFDWFAKTLKSLSGTDAFKSALRNGNQMHKLVTNIWDKAVAENKLDEAETAMEVLNVMSYGLLDSRTMNAVNQMDFTILSDSGLSWNKNPGINTAMKGADRALKWTIKGVGYAVTAGVNAVRRIGTGVRRSDKKEYLKNNNELAEARKNLDAQNARDDAAIEQLTQQQDGLDPTSQAYQDLQDQIDFYNTSKSDRTADFDAKDKKTKESYARLMAFWKLLRTGHTKTFFRISTARVQRKIHEQKKKHADGKMHDWLAAYEKKYMDYAA